MIAIKGALQEMKEEKLTLVTIIDDYSYLLLHGNNATKKWAIFLIRNLLKTFIQSALTQNWDLSELNTIEKEKLTFIILNFYQTISKTEFEKFQTNNRYYNQIVNPAINSILSTGVALSTDLVSKSLGLPSIDKASFYKEYVPKSDAVKPVDILSLENFQLMQIFNDLIGICHKTKFKTIVFFLDKVDEDSSIGGNVKEEAKLLLPILLNTSILLDNKFGLVFLLWSKVKEELNKKSVRFDKIKSIDVSWSQKDIREIMEKRILYFSNQTLTFDKLFQNAKDIDNIIYLSNGSPRDTLRLLSSIYDEEESSPTSQGLFSTLSVTKGINKFLTNSKIPVILGTV